MGLAGGQPPHGVFSLMRGQCRGLTLPTDILYSACPKFTNVWEPDLDLEFDFSCEARGPWQPWAAVSTDSFTQAGQLPSGPRKACPHRCSLHLLCHQKSAHSGFFILHLI